MGSSGVLWWKYSQNRSRCVQCGDSLRQWNQPQNAANESASATSDQTITLRSCAGSGAVSGAPAMRAPSAVLSAARLSRDGSARSHLQSWASRSKSQGESATAGAA